MNSIEIQHLPQKETVKGFKGRFVHTGTLTLAFWEIEKGAASPLHAHVHEQIMHVLEGQFQLTVEGETKVYGKDQLVVIPSNATHGGMALTDCKLLDIFSPVREDYKF